MAIKWQNVIKNQAKGMDPVMAYYKESERARRETLERTRKIQRDRQVTMEQRLTKANKSKGR